MARLASLRARSTIVAVLAVGAALAVGGIGLVGLLRSSLKEGVETSAQAQINNVTSLMRVGRVPTQLPVGRGDTITQVVAADGRVLASSSSLLDSRRISTLRPGEEGVVVGNIPTSAEQGPDHQPDPDGPYLLLSSVATVPARAGQPAMHVTVYVAGSLRPIVEATRTTVLALAVGLPVLVIMVGLLVWFFGGRALAPVEAIRAEVADISGHDLHRRVPTPAADDEVGRLARTMNGMLDRLESSAATQRRFVSDASHELRSPLATLQVTLEVALAHPDDAAWQSVAADALDETRRLHRLVEDLLVLARADEDTPGVARSELVDLDEMVLREARLARPTTSVRIDLHKVSGGRVLGDPHQLARVVHNLLDNARRHARTTVAVELRPAGDSVLLAVSDDGGGIDPVDRDRVFDRFARLDEARSQDVGGTGLGLAIVREIIEAHGGTVQVADSPVGARLEVRIPVEDADVS